MKISKTVYLSDKPTKKQLASLTINELVGLAKNKRSIKYPFKKYLVNYLFLTGIR